MKTLIQAFVALFSFCAAGCTPDGPLVFGRPSDGGPSCNDGGGCVCAEIGIKSCDPANPLVEWECIPAMPDAGMPDPADPLDAGSDPDAAPRTSGILQVNPCPPKSSCVEGMGCQPCMDTCVADSPFSCAPDMKTVTTCKPTGAAQCLGPVTELDCTQANLSVCEAPESAIPEAGPLDYCVNECGGRGVPLEHAVCSPHPDIPCAFWVCDGDTHNVKPDHIACLPSGAKCMHNEECVSCACINGLCLGSTKKSCVVACQ